MALGTWTAACLLLVAGALPADVTPWNKRELKFPITLDPEKQATVLKLILWVSSDQGQNWSQVIGVQPTEREFEYTAPADGLYWFAIQTVDKDGRLRPTQITAAVPSQKVLIDTIAPVFREFTASRRGDDVVVTWDVKEENPDLRKLKIVYHPRDARDDVWLAPDVPPNADVKGTFVFRPRTTSAVTVRMELTDDVGNTGQSNPVDVAGTFTPTSAIQSAPVMPPPASAPNSDRDDSSGFHNNPTMRQTLPSAPPVLPPGAFGNPGDPSAGAGTGWDQGGKLRVNSGPGMSSGPIADSRPGQVSHYQPTDSTTPRTMPSTLPPVQLVNKHEVTLHFAVERCGPSGLGSVEVFVTRDDGHTWQPFSAPQPLNVPLPPDGSLGSGPLHQSVTLTLPGEGLYGFYLVVKSGVGRGLRPPVSGDPPHVRVQVDETAPVARLWAPTLDPDHNDAVLFLWTASDPNGNLTPTPITLEWAERGSGPWNKIGADELPNTGRYSWKPPATGIPGKVFLRLTVRDAAGNSCIAQSEEAQSIDLVEPVMHVIKVSVGAQP